MHKVLFILCIILFSATTFAQSANGFGSSTTNPDNHRDQQLTTKNSLKGSGMMFTPNKGQIADREGNLRSEILYKGDGGGADIYLRKTGMSYVTSNMGEVMHEIDKEVEIKKADLNFSQQQADELKRNLEEKALIKIQRTDVDFAGSNPNPQTLNDEEVEGYTNYYYAHCPNGITNVKSYNRVVQKNIYNGIDVIYYGGKQNGLKYDIVVNPGANPGDIKLKYTGAKVKKLADGSLQIASELGLTREYLPKVYQNINGQIVDVGCKYKLAKSEEPIGNRENPTSTNGYSLMANHYTVSFELTSYNLELPLIIDPFMWATYYGSRTYCNDLTTDALGNAMFIGYTSSSSLPVSAGAFQLAQKGINDAFMVKFDPNGVRLWATYFGGTSNDVGAGIASDPNTNEIAITGSTQSSDFPCSAGAYQAAYGGGPNDAFVAKFDVNGLRLWATNYGGIGNDWGLNLTVDINSNVILDGATNLGSFPVTSNAAQALPGGLQDAFIVKFNTSGTRLWATYYGGSDSDGNEGNIISDSAGNILITGTTASTDFPYTPGAFQVANGGGATVPGDAYIVKFDTNGNTLWATYFGGNDEDHGRCIATDSGNNIIIVGNTGSTNLPVTTGAFQITFGGATTLVQHRGDAFVAKFGPGGNQLWATYHGGNTDDWAQACAVDKHDNIYVLGEWEDVDNGNFPMNTCAMQKTFSGGPPAGVEDMFVTKYTSNGKRICSTFIGGSGEDDLDPGGAIAVFNNYVYIGANNAAGGFPVTTGAFQTTYTDLTAVIGKFCGNSCGDNNTMNINFSTVPGSLCSNSSIKFASSVNSTLNCDTNSYIYKWYFPGGIPNTATNRNPDGIIYPSGTFTVSLVVDGICGRDSISKIITVNNCGCTLAANININANVTCYGGNNGIAQVTLSGGAGGPYTYKWSDGSGSVTSATNSQIAGLVSKTYSVTVTEGACGVVKTVILTQPPPVSVGLTKKWNCQQNSADITVVPVNGFAPYSYIWNGGQTGSTVSGLAAGDYFITITDKNNCSVIKSYTLIPPVPMTTDTVSTNISCTTSGQAIVSMKEGVPLFTYSWSNGKTFTADLGTSAISAPTAGGYTVTISDGAGCTKTQSFNIKGTSPVSANFTTSSPACVGTPIIFTNTGTTGTYAWTIAAPVNVSGTTANFSYTFLTPGTYRITHTVSNAGCNNTVSDYVTVTNCNSHSVSVTGGSVCSGSCATVISNATGGSGAYTYSWSTGATTQNINPCPVSSTIYTVTVTDSGGNTSTSSAVVTVNPAVTVTATSTNLTCSGTSTGSVTATPAGGTPAFNYVWSNGITTSTATNLAAGNYTVTVIDSKGCTSFSTTTIVSPPALLGQYTKGTANCSNCGCKEWIMVTGTGGTPPYNYQWPDGYDKRYKNALCPGVYNVIVTDDNGCKTTVKVNAP